MAIIQICVKQCLQRQQLNVLQLIEQILLR